MQEMVTTQFFGKNASYLIHRRNTINNDDPRVNMFSNEMTINLNVMFCSIMKNRININVKSYLVVVM